MSEAITLFAETSAQALEGAAELQELNERNDTEVDIMPRDEIFLISSFILNLRMAAYVLCWRSVTVFTRDGLANVLNICRSQSLEMLKHSRALVEARQERKGKRGLHWPDVGLGKWLSTGSEETEAITASESLNKGEDEEDEDDPPQWKGTLVDPGARDWTTIAKTKESDSRLSRELKSKIAIKKLEKDNMPWSLKARGALADFIVWVKRSDHVVYAFKFTFGVVLVSWPAFIDKWTLWYENARAGMSPDSPSHAMMLSEFITKVAVGFMQYGSLSSSS